MVYRHISKDMKERALKLLREGWDLNVVLSCFSVSYDSMLRWQQNFEQYGSVSAPTLPQGRPRMLSSLLCRELETLIREDPSLYLDEILDYLAVMHGQSISISALADNLRDLKLNRKVLRKIAKQQDEGYWTQWFDSIVKRFTAAQMVFTDESSKDGHTIARRYGCSLPGESPEMVLDADRGTRYSILPALTLEGYIALRVVEGSVDSDEMYDFVLNDLVPLMNPFPAPQSVLILDNCNIHKSEALRLAVEANGSILIFLPPYSPDFNPIEESFSCVKAYLCHHWKEFQDHPFPTLGLYEACMIAVNENNSPGWFQDSGYL